MTELKLSGEALQKTAMLLRSASGAFAESARVSIRADYGASVVEAAVIAFASALQKVSEHLGERSGVSSSNANKAHTEFAELDYVLARQANKWSARK